MSANLITCLDWLSKDIGDYWSSATTAAGTATTMVDAALMGKANDWITDDTYVILLEEPASTAAIYDERKVSSLSNTAGTLTTLTFAEAPGTTIDYSLHRLFTPSEKRIALIYACKSGFPHIFNDIWDETHVSGNYLKDGSVEIWTSTSALTYWTKSAITELQTSTLPYFKHGAYSLKMSTAAGYIEQSFTDNADLKALAGRYVTFTVQGWSNTASCLRLGIYDGTTTTYSDYHDGSDTWTEDDDPLTVSATIADNPTNITFRIYHDVAAAVSYVDDARVISSGNPRIFIDNLGLAQDRPREVLIESHDYSTDEPWTPIRGTVVDPSGYLYIPSGYPKDLRLRIKGLGYLDFLASGVSSTAWTATVTLDEPQLKILTAEAAVYLYRQMCLPNFSTGTNKSFAEGYAFWQDELKSRRIKYGMHAPGAKVDWGVLMNILPKSAIENATPEQLAKLIASNPAFANMTVAEAKLALGVSADITTHAALDTGIHGVGASTVASVANITTHAALTTAVHGAGGGTIATTAQALDTHGACTDITTLNASTTAHGLCVKPVAPAANLMNVPGIVNGETVFTNKPLFDGTASATLTVGGAGTVGTSVIASHRDHAHPVTNPAIDTLAAATDITTLNASNTAHGLVVKCVVPGAAALLNVVGIVTGETAYTNKVLFDATNPANLGTAAPGTAVVASHRDHVHEAPATGTSVKNKTETRAMTAATGDVGYTGYGFTPVALRIEARESAYAGSSTGSSGTAKGYCGIYVLSATALSYYMASAVIYVGSTTSLKQSAIVKTYDADGFTLTWTRTGATGAGTITFNVTAFSA